MKKKNNKASSEKSSTFGTIALVFFLFQTVAIGILPTVLGWNSLAVCSWGTMSYGMYAFVRPGRIMYRLKPKVRSKSPSESCVLDLIRAWGLFCVALGAMGLAVRRTVAESDNAAMTKLQIEANTVFLVVGLVSMVWDWHLMKSRNWEAENFLLVNLAANAAISIAAASGMIVPT